MTQTVFTTNLPQLLAKSALRTPTPEQARALAVLRPGEVMTLGPLPELALSRSFTIAMTFAGIWEPWTEADDAVLPPCLLQFGSAAAPGASLRISIRRELDGVRLEGAGGQDGVTLTTTKMKDGGILFVTLDSGAATVWFSSKQHGEDQVTDIFKLGSIGSEPGLLQVGSDSKSGEESPFAGLVGPVLVFDRPLASADIVKSRLLERLLFSGPLAGLLTAEESRPIASALVGIGWLGEKRFEVNRRDVIWPDPKRPDRWVLEYSEQPKQLDVLGVDARDHSIYSSMCMWCMVRRGGQLLLHGDAGQRFKLEYQGSNSGKTSFTGVSVGSNAVGSDDHISSLVLSVDGNAIDISPTGWTNAERKFFPKMLAPPGASVPLDDHEAWPDAIRLVRVAPTYDTIVDPQHRPFVSQKQAYKDAFSKRIATIGASSLGWDATLLDNTLNPLASSGANRTAQYYTLQSPADDSNYYRLENDIATPYYCFTIPLHDDHGSKHSTMYSSASEFSQKQSITFGASASLGKEKLFESSTTLKSDKTSKSSQEHTVVVAHHTTRTDAVILDKRWAALTGSFVNAILRVAANPDRDACFTLFETFGTHYPHAITYGSRAYSLGIIDAATMGTMVESGVDMKAAIGLPVEGVTVGVQGGLQKSTSEKADTALKTSMEFDEQFGSKEHPMPILLDLRPATELMQPPYVCDDALASCLPVISAYLDEFLTSRRKVPAPGYLLVQARLVSIENPTAQPVDVIGRAFLVAVDAQAEWQVVLPAPADRGVGSSRIWASTNDAITSAFQKSQGTGLVRVPASSSFTVDGSWPSAFLSIPRTRTDLVPAIGWTGVTTFFDEGRYHQKLDKNPEVAVAAGSVGLLSLGAGPLLGRAANKLGITHIATADEMHAAEDIDAGYEGFPFFGTDWAQGMPALYWDGGSTFTIQEKRKLHLAAAPKFTSVVINAGQVNAKFEVRVIDPTAFFDSESAFASA